MKKNCEELRRPYDDVIPMKTCIYVEIVSLVQMSGIIFEKNATDAIRRRTFQQEQSKP